MFRVQGFAERLGRACRVVGVSPVERSYHIFYMLCEGADDELRKKLGCVLGL